MKLKEKVLGARCLVLAAALVAGAGASAWAEDAPEEEVVATAEASLWLGPDEIVEATAETSFWLGPDEIVEATAETSFWLGPDGQPIGEGAWIVQTDAGCHIVGEGAATSVPEGFTRNTIKTATIDDGITEIGARFFKDFRRMSRVEGGKGLVRFGEKAFYRCLDLEEITIANPDFEVDCLNDAVVYQTAIDKDGKPYVVPSINIPGYENMLYGTDDLANPTWQPVDPKTKMEESGYHFFKFVLQKIGE